MPRVIFHLDMDAFFASVEQRDKPELRNQPVIVGGTPERRGVVCAASYEARRFGIHSAMPSRTAVRLCPSGIFISPRMGVYGQESRRIMDIVSRFGPIVEQVSVDEAYLDFSAQFTKYETDEALSNAISLAKEIKVEIRRQRDLTASVGVAANKLLAKIASDHGKPDGLVMIPERDKAAFLRPLPVETLFGVGKVTATHLKSLGLRTVGDLQDYTGDLRSVVGSFAPELKAFAWGRDDRLLETHWEAKSISAEETFPRDTDNRLQLRMTLWAQATEVADKLQGDGLAARTVQVKVRYGDFTTLTRQVSLEEPVESARDIYRLACLLLQRSHLVLRPLRLLGLGVAHLCPPSQQLKLDFKNHSCDFEKGG